MLNLVYAILVCILFALMYDDIREEFGLMPSICITTTVSAAMSVCIIVCCMVIYYIALYLFKVLSVLYKEHNLLYGATLACCIIILCGITMYKHKGKGV